MKKGLAFILAVSSLLFFVPNSFSEEGEWTGNLNLFLGQKSLDDDDWGVYRVEDQAELGIKVDFRRKAWPVNIAIDLFGSGDVEDNVLLPGDRLTVTTSELAFGVRKI